MKFLMTPALLLILVLTLASCANKKSADGRDHSAPPPPSAGPTPQAPPDQGKPATPPQTSPPTPPQPDPKISVPPATQPATSPLPVISFSEYQVELNSNKEVPLELLLSQASDVPVVVDVDLINGTAVHYRDFSGFKTRGNETRQTLVFAPGITQIKLPVIGRRNTKNCDTVFYARLDNFSVQKAQIQKDRAEIYLPCETYLADGL